MEDISARLPLVNGAWSIIVRRRGLEKGELLEGLPGRGGVKGGLKGRFEKGGLLKGASRGLLKGASRGSFRRGFKGGLRRLGL